MKLGNVQTMEEISGCIELEDPLDELWEHFSSPPRKHLHIVVQLSHDGEYPCHLFTFSTLLIDAPLFFSTTASHILRTVALLIVDCWFAIISRGDNSNLSSMDPVYPFFSLRASLLSSLGITYLFATLFFRFSHPRPFIWLAFTAFCLSVSFTPHL
jgi:hypothetical protein